MVRSKTLSDGHANATQQRAVLIIDDHPLYRSGLKAALDPLAVQFGEAPTLTAAMDALAQHRFDLILYDWHLPDGGGCKGLVAICQLASAVPVVVISADGDEAIQMAASSIGAVDCMSKATDATRMREVLGRLLARAPQGPPQPRASASRAKATVLTQRQHEVLQLMARGDPNKRIAGRLGIAETTVRDHVSDILHLMRARNRTEAVMRAQRESLIEPRRR